VDSIRIDLGEVGSGDVNWIDLVQNREKWRDLVNSVLNLWAPKNAKKLSSGLTSSLSRSAQLHRVRQLVCNDIFCSHVNMKPIFDVSQVSVSNISS
jgi:hypothetical protein